MQWIQHENNLELQTPTDFAPSIWVARATSNEADGYNMSVYLGTKRVYSQPVRTPDEGKAIADKWMRQFIQDLTQIVEA